MKKRLRKIINVFNGHIFVFHTLLFILIPWLNAEVNAEAKNISSINCNIQETPCTLLLSGREVTLDIQPKPVRAMNDLTFQVKITGEQISSPPYIELGMPGMRMGPNRVVLKEVAPGTYKGAGIIVRCPSGRRTWSATVTFPDLGEATFIFNVIY
jgi:hypothetical protein